MPKLEQGAPLCSLAPELIQAIGDKLTIKAVKNFRSTCKQLSELLGPRLFRELTISLSRYTWEKDLSKVRILATTGCHATFSGTRTLKVASLSPAYNPGHLRKRVRKAVDAKLVEKELKMYLFKAVSSLKGVQSVEWKPVQDDDDWAQKDVMNALKTLPNLRVLRLYTANFKFPLPLYDLSGIQEISICDINKDYGAEILDNVAKLVARSPNITSIDIHSPSSYYGSADKIPNLHQIFERYPRSSSPLRLRHLALTACLVKLDNVTLPHLQHLTSLSLMKIEDPHNVLSRWGTEPSSSKDGQIYGSSLDDIWKVLKTSRIYLEELALDVVVPSFLEYLASYSGLKKLRLTAGGFDEVDTSDSMARQFFSEPLLSHVQSLEDLSVTPPFEGDWCFGSWNQPIVSRCTNLKTFEIAIVSEELYPLPGGPNHQGMNVDHNIISLLMDTASSYMPQLGHLSILIAKPECFIPVQRCGNALMYYYDKTAHGISFSVNRYRSRPTCHRLPRVIVNSGKTFIPVGPDEDGCVHYTQFY